MGGRGRYAVVPPSWRTLYRPQRWSHTILHMGMIFVTQNSRKPIKGIHSIIITNNQKEAGQKLIDDLVRDFFFAPYVLCFSQFMQCGMYRRT